jgi:hypothetical protein
VKILWVLALGKVLSNLALHVACEGMEVEMISRTPTLADWPSAWCVRLACDLCPRRGRYRKLIARFDGDVLVPDV